ncbi:DNA/RNA non-specific endonuclease [Emticicia sp. SJ17W-69]|uniref:DNA/RNA non-specific endonuclease n=1 Tax=Emticicia sp. SJ17W-69 TaxID=3421657 RepID=UPI003EBCBFDE
MKSNRIILILIFFGIGYVLYYKDKAGPIGSLWKTVTGVFQSKGSDLEKKNPYKAPEPDNEASATKGDEKYDDVATATNKKSTDKKEPTKDEGSIFDKIKDKVFNQDSQEETTDNGEIPDFALPAIRKSDEIIKHKNYTLRYEEDYEVPAWVAHKLRGEYTTGRASRGDNQFMPDRKVKGNSALSGDYSSTGYDRGHMVPAGDFKCCQELMTETFYMSNICPQAPDFNRGIWENIESRIRGWAVRDEELFIVTGPVLRKGLPTIGRYNNVAVPEFFYKIALFYQPKSGKTPRAIAFLLPNEALHGKRMNNYVVSVDEVEKATGLDFFAKLPNELQAKLEANSSWEAWTKIQ